MDALNEKERTIALLKFLGLFLITVILVNVAIYIGAEVPKKQLTLLKEENAELTSINTSRRDIVVLTDSINARMGRYNTELNKGFVDAQINGDINKLANIAKTDSSVFSQLLLNVSRAYLANMEDKKRLGDSKNWSDKLAAKDKEIMDLKDKMKDMQHELDLNKVLNATSR